MMPFDIDRVLQLAAEQVRERMTNMARQVLRTNPEILRRGAAGMVQDVGSGYDPAKVKAQIRQITDPDVLEDILKNLAKTRSQQELDDLLDVRNEKESVP